MLTQAHPRSLDKANNHELEYIKQQFQIIDETIAEEVASENFSRTQDMRTHTLIKIG